MRLSTDRDFRGPRGLQRFGSLLLKELEDHYDVRLVRKNEKSDIHLSFINTSQKKGVKRVLRLDGVYYDRARLHQNKSIKRSVREVDGVIYQSKWAQIFVERMLAVRPKVSTVIHNGVCQERIKEFKKAPLPFKQVWMCCSHWRINKRLKTIVLAFLEACEGEDVGLYIAGKADYSCEHTQVKFCGHLNNPELFSLYNSAHFFCHICHLDACPNSVVEALSAGLPVLCNNIGGTPELVQNSGIVLPLDKPFDFRPIRSMREVGPRSIDQKIVVDGMRSMMQQKWVIARPELDISRSAEKYYNFFVRMLS